MATLATFIDCDSRDVDLPTGEYERVGGGAALEDAATTLLTGTRLGHEGKCPIKGGGVAADFIRGSPLAGDVRGAQAACLRGTRLAAAVSVRAGVPAIAVVANCIT
jgi:hypothetical protein